MIDFSALFDNYLNHRQGYYVALSVMDFKKNKIEYFKSYDQKIFFDLASLSKPLINGTLALQFPKLIDEQMSLLLNHRSGIAAWAILAKSSWKQYLLSLDIKKSHTLYSDLGAIRFLLELETKTSENLKEKLSEQWDKDCLYWLDLEQQICAPTQGRKQREVHDPNAFNLKRFVSHAGLFATIEGVSQTVMNLQQSFNFLPTLQKQYQEDPVHRFYLGWDRVENPDKTVAGTGCSEQTFGHLGFTGTSMWFDAKKEAGYILLTNDVRDHWYNKAHLNELRQKIGSWVWQNY